MRRLLLALSCITPSIVFADAPSALEPFAGYTIVAVMTITGYEERDGKRGSDFQGCDWDRKIIFDDSKVLTCAGYSYSYSYRPKAAVLTNGRSWKMLVGNNVYDMRR